MLVRVVGVCVCCYVCILGVGRVGEFWVLVEVGIVKLVWNIGEGLGWYWCVVCFVDCIV